MTFLHLLHKLARRELNVDQARVIMSLAMSGKTIAVLVQENPGLCPATPYRMLGTLLKRQRHGRSYVYRLTEDGMQLAKLVFDAETAPAPTSLPDLLTLPYMQN